MKFNGFEYFEAMGDKYKYLAPKLPEGTIIKLLYDDEETHIPGSRTMKKGRYLVTRVRPSIAVCPPTPVYELVKVGAKYDFNIYFIAIDKAIDAGVILVETQEG